MQIHSYISQTLFGLQCVQGALADVLNVVNLFYEFSLKLIKILLIYVKIFIYVLNFKPEMMLVFTLLKTCIIAYAMMLVMF